MKKEPSPQSARRSVIDQPSQQRRRYRCDIAILEIQLGACGHDATPSGCSQRLCVPPPTAVDVLRLDRPAELGTDEIDLPPGPGKMEQDPVEAQVTAVVEFVAGWRTPGGDRLTLTRSAVGFRRGRPGQLRAYTSP